jgi:Flp pilus assembly protein TadB
VTRSAVSGTPATSRAYSLKFSPWCDRIMAEFSGLSRLAVACVAKWILVKLAATLWRISRNRARAREDRPVRRRKLLFDRRDLLLHVRQRRELLPGQHRIAHQQQLRRARPWARSPVQHAQRGSAWQRRRLRSNSAAALRAPPASRRQLVQRAIRHHDHVRSGAESACAPDPARHCTTR